MECNKKAEPKNDLNYRLKSSEFCTDFWHIFWCLSLLSGIELATNVSFSEKVAVNISTVVQEFLHSITIRFQHVVGILLATTLSRILTAGKIFPYLLSFRVLWELFNSKNTFQFHCLFFQQSCIYFCFEKMTLNKWRKIWISIACVEITKRNCYQNAKCH